MNDRDGNSLILVLNCGSSSIKFALFDADATPLARTPAWGGKVEGITGDAPVFSESGAVAETLALGCEHPYHAALTYLRRRIVARLHGRRIVAIAHRVVHGGSKYFEPVRVDAAVLADLKSYIPLAPLHQPFALEAIGALLDELPRLPQVACFDTAFHQSMPTVEKMLPLPRSAWDQGLRRYGFHGLSYAYQAQVLGERYGDAARGRTIVAHLGSGASLCAMRNLQSVATTMGFRKWAAPSRWAARLSSPRSTATGSAVLRPSSGVPPCILRARIVATRTIAAGFRPAERHLRSKNFSPPRSNAKPASVTT